MPYTLLDVGMFYPPEAVAGMANTVAAFLEAAANAGYKVAVAARSGGSEFEFKERNGVHVMRTPLAFSKYEAGNRLQQLARELEPDFIISHIAAGYDPETVIKAARETGARIIHYLHTYNLLCKQGGMFRDQRNCSSICSECRMTCNDNLRITNSASGVISVSDHVLDTHRQHGHFLDTPSLVAPPIVGIRKASQRDGGDEPVFGFIGRIRLTKGVVHLLRVARERNLRLLVAGTGTPQMMQQLSAEFSSPRICFLGWQEPHDFFSKIDVCVVPSLFQEPFGRVAVEAQACGIPVVVSMVGGLKDTFAEGRTGWGYDPLVDGSLDRALATAGQHVPVAVDVCQEFAKRFGAAVTWPQLDEFFDRLAGTPQLTEPLPKLQK